jgi:hypothetical protein
MKVRVGLKGFLKQTCCKMIFFVIVERRWMTFENYFVKIQGKIIAQSDKCQQAVPEPGLPVVPNHLKPPQTTSIIHQQMLESKGSV